MSDQQPWGSTPPPPSQQPLPVHPNAHQWPAYRPPPPKPEQPLTSALLWTALFSFVGVLLFVVAIAALALLIYAAIWLFIASLGGESWDFWGVLAEVAWIEVVLGPVGIFIAVGTVVVFIVCTIALVLLRLSDGFRRWPAPLQGITAAGVSYLVSTVVLPVVGQVVAVITGT